MENLNKTPTKGVDWQIIEKRAGFEFYINKLNFKI